MACFQITTSSFFFFFFFIWCYCFLPSMLSTKDTAQIIHLVHVYVGVSVPLTSYTHLFTDCLLFFKNVFIIFLIRDDTCDCMRFRNPHRNIRMVNGTGMEVKKKQKDTIDTKSKSQFHIHPMRTKYEFTAVMSTIHCVFFLFFFNFDVQTFYWHQEMLIDTFQLAKEKFPFQFTKTERLPLILRAKWAQHLI